VGGLGRASLTAIVVVCSAALGTALFVQLYEEPTLRRNVRRWVPRLRAWKQ
jgi:hypothetical protein